MRRFILWLDEAAAFFEGSMRACRQVRLEIIIAVETNGGHAVDGDLRLLEARDDQLSGNVMERAA